MNYVSEQLILRHILFIKYSEMEFYELTGWADSDALASAGFGMDEDY